MVNPLRGRNLAPAFPAPIRCRAVGEAEPPPSGPVGAWPPLPDSHGDVSVVMCRRKHCIAGRTLPSVLPPSPTAHPQLYEVQTRSLGLTREEADICFLYGEWSHSCSRAAILSDEVSSSCSESSHPGMIRSQEHRALGEPLSSRPAFLSPCRVV